MSKTTMNEDGKPKGKPKYRVVETNEHGIPCELDAWTEEEGIDICRSRHAQFSESSQALIVRKTGHCPFKIDAESPLVLVGKNRRSREGREVNKRSAQDMANAGVGETEDADALQKRERRSRPSLYTVDLERCPSLEIESSRQKRMTITEDQRQFAFDKWDGAYYFCVAVKSALQKAGWKVRGNYKLAVWEARRGVAVCRVVFSTHLDALLDPDSPRNAVTDETVEAEEAKYALSQSLTVSTKAITSDEREEASTKSLITA